MIHLTRINNQEIVLNSDLIEQIEMVPDTMIALTTGQKLYVLEPVEEVVNRIVSYRKRLMGGTPECLFVKRQAAAECDNGAERE